MRNIMTKIHWLYVLILILLLSSCETQCGPFDRQSELMTIVLFPEQVQHYEFEQPNNPNAEILRLTKERFEFSEAYVEKCGNDCDCVSSHTTRYQFESLPMALGNEITYEFIVSDPLFSTMTYTVFNLDFQILDDTEYKFPTENREILRDINNLVATQLTVNGETFNDVLTVNLDRANMTLFVERRKGLQGILYQGQLYRRTD